MFILKNVSEDDYLPAPIMVMKFFDCPTTHARVATRCGWAKTMKGVEKIIADDRAVMRNTYGGLIEATPQPTATYRVYRSAGWEHVEAFPNTETV